MKILLPLFALLLLQGCAAHVYNVPGERAAPVITRPIEGTILAKKDQIKDRILRESGIVRETRGRMVYLEIEYVPKCGLPFLGSAMTFGLIPAEVLSGAEAEVSVWKVGGEKTRTRYLLRLNRRYSLWEGLAFWHDDEKVMARALGWAYESRRLAP